MPYTINRYNGTQLTVVEEGTLDNSLSIKLIGKNYAGYGEIQNENFVHILENFSGITPPSNALSGQIWFDSANGKLKFYTGSAWKTTNGSEVSPTAPVGLSSGDFWYNPDNNQLFVWDSGDNDFVLIGPQGVPGLGVTQMKSVSVTDTYNAVHAIIEAIVNDKVVYIISADTFTLHPVNSVITGFSYIKQGITLVNTDTDGITQPNSSGFRHWGTASDSDRLGGLLASSYISTSNPNFTSLVKFSDLGYVLGNDEDLAVYIESGTIPVIKNQVGDTIKFQTTSSGVKTPLTLVGLNILPGTTSVSDIGSSSYKYNNVWANTFRGRATEASYADLAEKYLADKNYEVGTAVTVGGDAEVTAANSGSKVIGVVSENPAFKMNVDLENGTFIALAGRVPVKVKGSIEKGDGLIASTNGVAVAAHPCGLGVFAIALESNDSNEIKLVESVIL